MCIICIEMQKGRLTTSEARRNFIEMEPAIDSVHREELREKLMPKTIYDEGSHSEEWWVANNNYTAGSD